MIFTTQKLVDDFALAFQKKISPSNKLKNSGFHGVNQPTENIELERRTIWMTDVYTSMNLLGVRFKMI